MQCGLQRHDSSRQFDGCLRCLFHRRKPWNIRHLQQLTSVSLVANLRRVYLRTSCMIPHWINIQFCPCSTTDWISIVTFIPIIPSLEFESVSIHLQLLSKYLGFVWKLGIRKCDDLSSCSLLNVAILVIYPIFRHTHKSYCWLHTSLRPIYIPSISIISHQISVLVWSNLGIPKFEWLKMQFVWQQGPKNYKIHQGSWLRDP